MQDIDQARRSLDIFSQVIALPDNGERREALQRLCGDDELLRRKVEALLAADRDVAAMSADRIDAAIAEQLRKIDPLLTSSVRAARPPADDSLEAAAPQVSGEYTILRLIGEGGMGTVYEAEQHSPRRRVAIKVIHPGRLSPQLRRRFEYEAQVLGRLEHPNIARLYAYDTQSKGGRIGAFLAMELVVDGQPIDGYCTSHDLDMRSRLRLLIKVCGAVAYAHRMGVVHRDLKPQNIIVTPEGEPKILDFGIARIIDRPEGGESLAATLTQDGQVVGTLAYMSPEQVEGLPDVDTRSDVYSLGVILYKLLTGQLPIPLENTSLASAADRLLHHVPTPLGAFDRQLRGDLEVIAARTLEKERDRRYASVEQLCAEIERYLDGRPIQARADSRFYVIRRTLWRHRGLAAAVAVFVLLLIGFGIYASMASHRNRQLAEAATLARDAAVMAEGRANANAEQSRQALYVSRIGFAQAAMQNDDIERVQTLLNECEPSLRGWEWYYLRQLCDLSVQTRPLNIEWPRYRSQTSDGSLIAYASVGREILLMDRDGHERLREMLPEGTARVAVSPDGRWLAFGGVGERVTLVDLQSPALPRRDLRVGPTTAPQDVSQRGLRAICFTEDGKSLLVAGADRALRHWDVESATLRRTFSLGDAPPVCMTSLPGTSLVLVGDNGGSISAYDVTTGGLVFKLTGHNAQVWSLAISNDGHWLASGDDDARVILWDLKTHTLFKQLDGNDGWTTSIAFNDDGSMIALGRADSTIRLLRLPDLSSVAVLRGHQRAVIWLRFQGDRLHSASIDGTVKDWDPHSTEGIPTIQTGQQQTFGLSFTPSGDAALVGGADGTISSIRLSPQPSAAHRFIAGDSPDLVWCIANDPIHNRIATATRGGFVQLFDATTGSAERTLLSAGTPVPSVCFLAHGTRLLAATTGKITVLDVESARTIASYPTPGYLANSLIVDATGTSFYAACSDGKLRRWNVVAGSEPVGDVMVDPAGAYDVALTPDGKFVAVGGDGGSVRLFDAQSLNLVRQFAGHQTPVTCVAFDPTGTRLATCGNDRTIRIWDVATGTQLITLRGHRRPVRRIAFSPDGATLASTSDDGTVRLWRAPVRGD